MQILERPYNISYSLNDIRYVFQMDDLTRSGLKLQVQLLAKPLGGTFTEVYTFLLQPAPDGKIYLYVQEYINSLLTYVLPAFDTSEVFTNADMQACLFTIHYREISDGVAVPDYTTTEETYTFFAIKGGIEKHLHSRNNFFRYFESLKPFLTWQPSGRFIDFNEVIFFTFLNPNYRTEDLSQAFTLCYRLTDIAGAVVANTIDFIITGLLTHICFNVADLNTTLDITKLYTLELGVVPTGNGAAYTYEYYFEHRPRYNYYDLLYHNSLGGLDFVRVKGDVDESIDRTTTDGVGGMNVLDMFGNYKAAEAMYAGIQLQKKYKGDVGYLMMKKAQYALLELLSSGGIYMRNHFRFVPVNALQKSQDIGTKKSSLNSFPIEWALSETNEVYTPEVLLGLGDALNNVVPVVSNVIITRTGTDIFAATFDISAPSDHYKTELNTDGNWIDVSNNAAYQVAYNGNSLTYYISGGSYLNHGLRITPYYDVATAGTAGVGNYVAVCPNVTGVSTTNTYSNGVFVLAINFTPVQGVSEYEAVLTNTADGSTAASVLMNIADTSQPSVGAYQFDNIAAGDYQLTILTDCTDTVKSSGVSTAVSLHADTVSIDNVSPYVQGTQTTSFDIIGTPGAVLQLALQTSGYVTWSEVASGATVILSAQFTSPAGATSNNNINLSFPYQSTGSQSLAGASANNFEVTIPSSGTLTIQTTASLQNGGTSPQVTAEVQILQVNSTATNINQSIYVG